MTFICDRDALTTYYWSGDQVSKKGGMTGGFYDHRRSKLKFMNMIMQNTKSINIKEEELEKVRFMLQDILFHYFFFKKNSFWTSAFSLCFHLIVKLGNDFLSIVVKNV
jgi:hypothetical protein